MKVAIYARVSTRKQDETNQLPRLRETAANRGYEIYREYTDEERAKALSQDRGVRVLVTNLPRAPEDAENIRFGATADTVLKAYLGQYKVEHAFRLAKDGMKMSRVYVYKPSRENVMMFVISLGTMVSDVMRHVLKTKGIDTTTDGIAGRWFTLMFRYDRANDSEFFQGSDDLIDEFLDAVQALGLDQDRLIH